MRLRSVAAVTFMLALASVPAQAQWFAGPYVGASFGGSAFGDDEDAGINGGSKLTVGGNFGWLDRNSVVGFEIDFGYVPNAIDDEFFDVDAKITTLMVNTLFARSGGTIRPYGTVGAGILKTSIDDANDFIDVTTRDFGVNVGGGIIGDFSPGVGWRGDVRYFRALVGDEDRQFDVGFGDLDFWRAVFAVSFRFGG